MMREDFLASVAVVDVDGPAASLSSLTELHGALSERFRYFELLYVVAEPRRVEITPFADQLSLLKNLRIILSRDGASIYRKRAIAASEAIGDIVALFDPPDLAPLQLADLLVNSWDTERIMLGWRPKRLSVDGMYRMLAVASRNHISARASRTIVLPRNEFNALAARGNLALDLRFEPRNPPTPYEHFATAHNGRSAISHGERYQLAMEILLSGAPRYLKAFAGVGFLVVLGSALYALYALAIVLLRDNVQQGWFSTAIVLSGSTAFISAGMSIVSIALSALLDKLNGGDGSLIIDELANISFFGKISDRNVELSMTESGAESLDIN